MGAEHGVRGAPHQKVTPSAWHIPNFVTCCLYAGILIGRGRHVILPQRARSSPVAICYGILRKTEMATRMVGDT